MEGEKERHRFSDTTIMWPQAGKRLIVGISMSVQANGGEYALCMGACTLERTHTHR